MPKAKQKTLRRGEDEMEEAAPSDDSDDEGPRGETVKIQDSRPKVKIKKGGGVSDKIQNVQPNTSGGSDIRVQNPQAKVIQHNVAILVDDSESSDDEGPRGEAVKSQDSQTKVKLKTVGGVSDTNIQNAQPKVKPNTAGGSDTGIQNLPAKVVPVQHKDSVQVESDFSDDEGLPESQSEASKKSGDKKIQLEVSKIMKKSRLSEGDIRFVVENFPSVDFSDEDSDGVSDLNDSSDSDDDDTQEDVLEIVEVELPAPDNFYEVRILISLCM
jgi:hypothetical protein